jgi:hypothetical protein
MLPARVPLTPQLLEFVIHTKKQQHWSRINNIDPLFALPARQKQMHAAAQQACVFQRLGSTVCELQDVYFNVLRSDKRKNLCTETG